MVLAQAHPMVVNHLFSIYMIPQCTCISFWPIVVSCIRMKFDPVRELHSPSRQEFLVAS